ncbi:MAG: nucleoside monophosphate kinase [Marinilabiliales bacterium]|nr:nucleoside monophosphate kinase [Marinilabiliales bacterium]
MDLRDRVKVHKESYWQKNMILVYISTGSLLRKEIEKGSEMGLSAKEYMEKGDIVPDEFAIKLIEKQIKLHPNAKGFSLKDFQEQ